MEYWSLEVGSFLRYNNMLIKHIFIYNFTMINDNTKIKIKLWFCKNHSFSKNEIISINY